MISDLFKPYDFAVLSFGTENPKAVIVSYKLTCPQLNLVQSFSWSKGKETLEAILKSRVNKLIAVIANGAKLDDTKLYDAQQIIDFIDNNYVSLTPDSKLESILEYIGKQTSFDGEAIAMPTPKALKLAQLYFNNGREWRFYMDSAVGEGLVKKTQRRDQQGNDTGYHDYALTVPGLSRLIRVTEGKSSRYSFIAMAFKDDMYTILEQAIKPALSNCGFEAIVVSEVHQPSDKTINDAILAGIKKARFTIADFTYHRGGVYFEAGYALGRGQSVIYTCREDEMNKAHFDIRNYQHIVWTDASDLQKKLIDKIEAFIKD